MEDIELGYRLFRYGAKMYYSEIPLAIHLKSVTGGSRKLHNDVPFEKLVSILYIYKKHFPGWGVKQLLLYQLWKVFRAKKNLMNALLVFKTVKRLYKANSIANKLIK